MMMMRSCKRRSSSSSSAEAIGHNEDLMTKILLPLPVKSILRFRSVSKQWNSLLTHPQFINQYNASLTTTTRDSFLFFKTTFNLNGNYHNLEKSDFSYLRKPTGHSLHLKASCNGLLLFRSINDLEDVYYCNNKQAVFPKYLGEEPATNIFYVCNPFTRKHRLLQVPKHLSSNEYSSVHLAFDPSTSPYYKVILIWKSEEHQVRTYHIVIYSSETKNWRKLDYVVTDRRLYFGSDQGIFFNGAIFWLDDLLVRSSSYFQIDQESISTVLPKPPYSKKSYRYLGGGYGHHLYLVLGNVVDPILDVFDLKEDFSSWTLKYKVDLDFVASVFPQINYRCNKTKRRYLYNIVCILEKEGESSMILEVGNELLVTYNSIDKTTKKLCDIRKQVLGYASGPFGCIESLFSV